MVNLAEAFRKERERVASDLPPAPTREESELAQVRGELTQLRVDILGLAEAMRGLQLPTPQVTVQSNDELLNEQTNHILQSIAGLKPGASAEEIAAALAPLVSDNGQTDTALALNELRKITERLVSSISGLSRSYGGAGPTTTTISDDANREVGKVTVLNPTTNPETGLAKDSTLIQVRDFLDTVETKLQSVIDEILRRPSQQTGRAHKHIIGDNLTADTTLYTVTAGKVLYITSLVLTARNTDLTTEGRFSLRDDTTVKLPFLLGIMATGSSGPSHAYGLTFTEPIQFSANVNLDEVTGDVHVSCALTGYEQ